MYPVSNVNPLHHNTMQIISVVMYCYYAQIVMGLSSGQNNVLLFHADMFFFKEFQ